MTLTRPEQPREISHSGYGVSQYAASIHPECGSDAGSKDTEVVSADCHFRSAMFDLYVRTI